MRAHLLFILFLGMIVLSGVLAAPADAQRSTNTTVLLQLSDQFRQQLEQHRPQLYYDMLASSDPAQVALNMNPDIQLMFIDDLGMPKYYEINNLNAAHTISTSRVWPSGGAGYTLTGSGTSSNQLAVWDAGGVLLTHQEFGGRVSQIDSPSSTHYHSTHVAGTMVAAGVVANAKGMSYQANLSAYDYTSDDSEMATAAAGGLLVSSHSYGYSTGWRYNSSSGDWYWWGNLSISTAEDYEFGFYSSYAEDWDQIAYNAPNYLIVTSAGNDRDDGPSPGTGHYHWNGFSWVWSTDTHDRDGAPDGYDCLGSRKVAKNLLVVGAVSDIPTGYSEPADVVQASFSSWGPADDGRVKPDIVGNGISLYSTTDTGNSDYYSMSGTSASSPNVAGSVNLLVRHFETEYSSTPRAATMKAVVIHAADEAGAYDGPDYQNGWGLMNTESAADVIALSPPQIVEDNLVSGSDTHNFTLSEGGNLRVTICWTDPPGTPTSPSLDPTTPMLVNDLDLRLEHVPTATIYYPWRLDPANPANAATTGDNSVDNVEVIDVACAPAGAYIATVSHKGSLGAGQDYSLVWSSDAAANLCSVEPTPIDFGSIDMNTYADETFTITNNGCNTLSGTVSESSAHFSIESGGGAYSLLPGEILTVTVRFLPTTLGPHSTTIETGDAACSDVFCTGYSLEPPPICTLSADTLDFGDVTVGESPLLSFTITNTGYQTLSGNVGEPCPFVWIVLGAGGFSLGHDEVHNVNVVFAASAPGPDTCIVNTGTEDCSDVVCIINGVSPPECSVDPAAIDFGTVLTGSTKDTTITITNTGGGTLSGSVSETCDHYSIVSGGGAYSLANSESHIVTLRFEPTATGTHNCTIETGDALCTDVSCTGVGEEPTACSVDPAAIDFGTVLTGSTKDTTITITNTGGGTLSGSVSETCDHYSIVSGGGAYSLANSESHIVTLRFEPTATGTHNCTIETGDALCTDVSCTGVGEEPTGIGTTGPLSFDLFQNYPNPFKRDTNIRFSIDREGTVELRVYDTSGQLVRTLVNRSMAPGIQNEHWDGLDDWGNRVASGIYFYQLKMGKSVVTRKAVLLK